MPVAEALQQTIIEPTEDDYRHLSIQKGFDFNKIIKDTEKIRGSLAGKALYLVVFRSKLNQGADEEHVAQLDTDAHEEALTSPELYAYFQGERNVNNEALSMCLWGSAKAAFEAVHGQNSTAHKKAANSAQELYGDNYEIEFYNLLLSVEGLIFVRHQHPQKKTEELHYA